MKNLLNAEILYNAEIKSGIYDMRLNAPEFAKLAVPGQFMNLYLDNGRNILPRPLSICRADGKSGSIGLIYKVVGEGTEFLSRKRSGGRIRLGEPVGNGFRLPEAAQKRILLAGGGVGTPPLLFLAEKSRENRPDMVIIAAMGFRSESQVILEKEFAGFCDGVVISTDDGGYGERGTAVDAVKRTGVAFDGIYACGPKPMLRAIAAYAAERAIPCQVSMEEHMACGIGACLGCAVRVRDDTAAKAGGHGAEPPVYKRVCKDGPVFDAREVAWDE
ncbi:MAG: dihydroorotate dehydrogenase electron transfer subunit [Defluviitaleaceae bacterium]|nr:dihydroorotate dehydrogenase electron transfer subunit [Defluviitaleaceae bacterium]